MDKHNYLVILTGGIASGKSTVAGFFVKKGIVVIDADKIAHDVVKPLQPGWHKIKEHFGEVFFHADGSLNREKLRLLIYECKEKKQQLEAILHPLISQEMEHQYGLASSPYIIFDIPLFAENADYYLQHYPIDSVLVVDAPVELQISRLFKRDGIKRREALKIIQSQASREQRNALADTCLLNTSNLQDLQKSVNSLHLKYLSIATKTCRNAI